MQRLERCVRASGMRPSFCLRFNKKKSKFTARVRVRRAWCSRTFFHRRIDFQQDQVPGFSRFAPLAKSAQRSEYYLPYPKHVSREPTLLRAKLVLLPLCRFLLFPTRFHTSLDLISTNRTQDPCSSVVFLVVNSLPNDQSLETYEDLIALSVAPAVPAPA